MTYSNDTDIITNDSEAQAIKNSFDSDYYTSHRIPVILQSREIGKVFAEIKGNLVVIAGENKKEHEYIIPRSVVSHCDEKQAFIDITANSLKEFEI
ncbi:MAG: hypothetical protein GEU26_02805 [Nitrososphaeraceae archaeon]|nr:hypothetical protein [Nitrososphaeraceae archaeon]